MVQNIVGLFFIRLSVGVFVLRMLSMTQVKLRTTTYVAMLLNFSVALANVCVMLLWCRPIQGIWNKTVPAECLSNVAEGNASRAFAGMLLYLRYHRLSVSRLTHSGFLERYLSSYRYRIRMSTYRCCLANADGLQDQAQFSRCHALHEDNLWLRRWQSHRCKSNEQRPHS